MSDCIVQMIDLKTIRLQ